MANQFTVIENNVNKRPDVILFINGLEAKAGSISAGFSRFMAWKTSDGKVEASPLIGQLETLIKGILDKKTLLDLIRHFIVFEKSKKEDKKTGIITIQTVKILAAYHQYYAVNLAVESTMRASAYSGQTGHRFRFIPVTFRSEATLAFHYTSKWPE